MMYAPAHYQEDRLDLMLEVIRKYDFATLVTVSEGAPFVSHLPLLLEPAGQSLIGHCARANPQWRHFVQGQVVTAIFQGPHSYISPAWYAPEPDNVPTWNYVAVHVRAKAELIDEPEASYEVMRKLVDHYERKYKTGWALPPVANEELKSLLKGIVSFRLVIESLQGKFKLSQKQSASDRRTVIEELPRMMGEDGRQVAEYMKLVMGKPN